MAGAGKSLESVFESFCSFGSANNDRLMDNAKFAKLFRDLKVLDKKLTATDIDIIFSKVKVKSERKINFEQFKEALKLTADKKYPGDADNYKKLENLLCKGKGPQAKGVTKTVDSPIIDRMTDTSKYTGSHKERFDESGKGKGLEGRDSMKKSQGMNPGSVSSNASYVTGYKHEGTYEKKVQGQKNVGVAVNTDHNMGIDFCKRSTVVVPVGNSKYKSTSSSQSSSVVAQRPSVDTHMGSFRSRASLKILQLRRTNIKVIDVAKEGSGEVMQFHLHSQIVQNYHIEKIIGKGSFSHVLLVRNIHTNFHYAMKIVDNHSSYEREISILKRVRHPNIVHLYEGHITETKVYFVLEVANGGDLATRLHMVTNFEEKFCKTILTMLLSALEYLHKNGVTHRDLKLENCLFKTEDENSIILLTDFGLAYLQPKAGVKAAMQTTCGTPDYISPEMLNGELYTEKVDMWALGVILYAILSGDMPFSHDNRAEMYRKINRSEYSQSSGVWISISNDAINLISMLLCVNPERRLSAETAQHHSWITTHTIPPTIAPP